MAVRAVPGSYATIAAALAAAVGTDDVQIDPGTYAETNLYVGHAGRVRRTPGATGNVVVQGGGGSNTFRVHGACTFSDIIAEGASVGVACFRLNTDGVTLERCTARAFAGYGAYSTTNAHVLSRVRATGAGAVTAVDLNGSSNGQIANLLIDGTQATGLRPPSAGVVRDLTITGCSSRGLSNEAGATVRNLTAFNNPGVGIYLDAAGADVDYYCTNGNGTATAIGAGGGTLGVHAVTGDPLYAVDLLSMDPASPVRDAGTTTGIVEDFVGGTRPVGAEDIGHLEWQSDPPQVTRGEAPDLTHVLVTFDQAMDAATVEAVAGWSVAPVVAGTTPTVTGAEQTEPTRARLTLGSSMTADAVYRVTAPATAESTLGDVVDPAHDTADFVTPALTASADDIWAFLAEPTVAASDAAFPFALQAVSVAILADARALDSDGDPLGDGDMRGWWGDHFRAADHAPLGSRVWTRYGDRATQTSATAIRDLAAVALRPLVSEGLATAAEVTTALERLSLDRRRLSLFVDLVRGASGTDLRLADLWEVLRVDH